MTRWKKTNPRDRRRQDARDRRRREALRESGDQCVVCFAISWLYDHDHGREFEPLIENLVEAIEGNGYQVWNGSRPMLDEFLDSTARAHGGAGQDRHLAVAVAAIERSWERHQQPA